MNSPRESRDIKPTAIGYLYTAVGGLTGSAAIEVQRASLHAFCRKQGLALDFCYTDFALSRRGRTQAVRRLLSQQGPQVLVVASLARLTRNPAVFSRIVDRILAKGRHLVSADGQLDTRTQPGRLMVELMRVCGEVERDNAAPTLH